jgi:tetratricopeptide (TPR) repeat protein
VKPRIFLSAVSSELKTARQLGANILTRLGYEPVWQDIFGTEAGDLRQMLVDKIDSCDGLIHLVGFGYGAEPLQPDPEFGRVSYTQYEFLHAQKTGKKTWILFVEDGFPADKPPEQLDLPADGHSNPAAFQAERRRLQDAWRQRLLADGHLRHGAATTTDFELTFERLKDELRALRRSFRNWQRVVVGLLLFLVVLGGIVGGILYARVFRVQESVEKHNRAIEEQLALIRPDDIKKQLRDTIEETYQKELREADRLPDWKKRADAKKDAAEFRDKRLGQVDEFLDSITSNIKSGEATPELLEFTRILQDQGAAEAVKYIDLQEKRLLVEAEKLTLQKRRTLLPILEAVKIHFNRGEFAQARDKCEKLLLRDGDWSEALLQHVLVMDAMGDRALRYEKIETAFADFQAFEKSARRRSELDPKDRGKERDLWVAIVRLAGVDVRLGHAEDALKHCQNALKISSQLAEDDPKDREKQRDLTTSLDRLGDIYMKVGGAEEALKQYEDALRIRRKLLEDDPKDAEKQRDLALSFGKLGDLYMTLARAEEALKPYEEGLKISRKLAENDPKDSEKQRDLAVSLFRLGDVCVTVGRAEEALKLYEDGLRISRKRAEGDSNDAYKQRDLVLSLHRLGDVYVKLGRAAEALKPYEDGLKISRKLAADDPKNAHKHRDVSLFYDRLGGVYESQGRTEEAMNQYKEGLKHSQRLAEDDPKDARKQRDVMVSFHRLGILQKELGAYEAAIEQFRLGIAVLDKLIEAKVLVEPVRKEKAGLERDVAYCQRAIIATGDWEALLKSETKQLPELLSLRATELAKHGLLGDVEQAATRLREWKPASPDTLYDSGCAYGLCALLVVKGKAKPSDDAVKAKRKYTDLALACLKEAIAAGYKDFDHMKKDSDLAALRNLPEFQAMFQKK